jgi:predicted hotdog family 3-hydroxylacyl-ACP dehydratase
MIINNIDIRLLIPQREPFVMIESLLRHSKKSAMSSFTILSDNVMLEDNMLSEEGLLENMAQTAAAHLGYITYVEGFDSPIGFIAAVKNLSISKLAHVGETIETTITYTNTILNIHLVNAAVTLNGIEIANAELRIFIKE